MVFSAIEALAEFEQIIDAYARTHDPKLVNDLREEWNSVVQGLTWDTSILAREKNLSVDNRIILGIFYRYGNMQRGQLIALYEHIKECRICVQSALVHCAAYLEALKVKVQHPG